MRLRVCCNSFRVSASCAFGRDCETASQRIARAEVERCGFSKLELNVVRSIYLRIIGDCKTEASRKARSA
jgi:hypothetical protein